MAIALVSTRYSVGQSCGTCQLTLYRPIIALGHSVSASTTVNEFIRAYNFSPLTFCAPTAMRIDTLADTPERSTEARIMAGRQANLLWFLPWLYINQIKHGLVVPRYSIVVWVCPEHVSAVGNQLGEAFQLPTWYMGNDVPKEEIYDRVNKLILLTIVRLVSLLPPELPEHKVAARFGGNGVLPAQSNSLIPVGVSLLLLYRQLQCENCVSIALHHMMCGKLLDSLCIAWLLAL